jgi:NAD(P)-dependent dehydrogenase (short-subunit alcohol dehydrogenase family)
MLPVASPPTAGGGLQVQPVQVVVAGATGATGRLVVRLLLEHGARVRALVRPGRAGALVAALGEAAARAGERLAVVEGASLPELSAAELDARVAGCDAIVQCLGHNLSLSGVALPPWRLVRDSCRALAEAAQRVPPPPQGKVRLVVMGTVGVMDPDGSELALRSWGQRLILNGLLMAIPPHADNWATATYLRSTLGSANDRLSWCLVRPDALTDATEVTPYTHQTALFPGIFDNQKRTSRINTAHFMAQLAADPEAFAPYAGKMPTVIDTDSLPVS